MVVLAIILVALAAGLAGAVMFWKRGTHQGGHATAASDLRETMHRASVAVSALRSGLTASSAIKAAPALRQLLGTPAVAIADQSSLPRLRGQRAPLRRLAPLPGPGGAVRAVTNPVRSGPEMRPRRRLPCSSRGHRCNRRGRIRGRGAGGIGAVGRRGAAADRGRGRPFVSTHLELAELDASRTRTMQAQLNFLRAQISPHFIYNALTAIESYVRSDPERARDLLCPLRGVIRWTFRERSQYTTLAEELRFVDTYLELERARFGDRLEVSLRVAPEVLPVKVPSLVLLTPWLKTPSGMAWSNSPAPPGCASPSRTSVMRRS